MTKKARDKAGERKGNAAVVQKDTSRKGLVAVKVRARGQGVVREAKAGYKVVGTGRFPLSAAPATAVRGQVSRVSVSYRRGTPAPFTSAVMTTEQQLLLKLQSLVRRGVVTRYDKVRRRQVDDYTFFEVAIHMPMADWLAGLDVVVTEELLQLQTATDLIEPHVLPIGEELAS